MMKWQVELSKEISYALRHAPWEYELEMDEAGWVLTEQLLDGLRRKSQWRTVSADTLREVIRLSEKKRFEMKDGKIRAFYGHSIPMRISKEEKRPPDVLYHGTARRFLESIRSGGLLPRESGAIPGDTIVTSGTGGLLPRGRQYDHLSQDVETAECVGKRHDGKPCILVIDAKRAWQDGVKFYLGNEKVWLADSVSCQYIHVQTSAQV